MASVSITKSVGEDYEITELLYATTFISTAGACWGDICSYNFRIDKNGNVNVKFGRIHYSNPQPKPTELLFEIVDNIKVPDYIIQLYKHLIKTHLVSQNMGNGACRLEKTEMFFEIVKNLKKSIKNIYDNPENYTDIKLQIDLYKHKNKIFKNELTKMNTKIENIQTAYFDTLNDNKQMKDENKLLKEKIKQLETDIKTQKAKTNYTSKPIYTTPTQTSNLGDCWSNPGGATIYTQPNAQNRMVYNETSGIYEPGEDD